MKTTVLLFSVACFLLNNAVAQQTSPRGITKKVSQRVETRNQATKAALADSAAPEPPVAKASPPASSQAQGSSTTKTVAAVPAVPEKSKAEKVAIDKKTLAFQRQRALSGQPSAQFDLGIRYLNGDGVEKNPGEARKWIELSAKQNYTLAVKKLEELDKGKK